MVCLIDKNGTARFALDSSQQESFTQRPFSDLISDSHMRGQDYYIARVHCLESPVDSDTGRVYSYYCYDAKQLCKYAFEMLISTEGRRIRIKNFRDPVSQKEMSEVNFFRLRCDSETPLHAEYVGSHVNFLESNIFRSKLFLQDDAMDSLSVNFQFKSQIKDEQIKKKSIFDLFLIVVMLILVGFLLFKAVQFGKDQLPEAFSGRPEKLEKVEKTE